MLTHSSDSGALLYYPLSLKWAQDVAKVLPSLRTSAPLLVTEQPASHQSTWEPEVFLATCMRSNLWSWRALACVDVSKRSKLTARLLSTALHVLAQGSGYASDQPQLLLPADIAACDCVAELSNDSAGTYKARAQLCDVRRSVCMRLLSCGNYSSSLGAGS